MKKLWRYLVLLPVLTWAGTIIPEFVVTENYGDELSNKTHIVGSCNRSGEIVLAWLDWRDGGKITAHDQWPQVYTQYIDREGNLEGYNAHIQAGGDFNWFTDNPAILIFSDGYTLTAVSRAASRTNDTTIFSLWSPESRFIGEPETDYQLGFCAPVKLATANKKLCVAAGVSCMRQDTLEFQIFTRTGQLLTGPVLIEGNNIQDIMMDSEGNIVIAYAVEDSFFHYSLYYQRYTQDGEPRGNPVRVISSGNALAISGEANGELMCAWEGFDGIIYCRLFSHDDNPQGSTAEIGDGAHIDIAQGYGGQYLAVWSNSDTILGRLINASGVPQGNAFSINEPGTGNVYETWVGSDAEDYKVAWIQSNSIDAGYHSSKEVYYRFVTPSGTLAGPQSRVDDEQPGMHSAFNEPLLSPDSNFYIICNQSPGPSGTRGAFLFGYSKDTTPLNEMWSSEECRSSYPALAPDGSIYISYHTEEDDINRVWVQVFNTNCLPTEQPWLIDEFRNDCWNTAIAVNGERLFVVWEEETGPGNGDVRLWGQIIDLTGKKIEGKIIVDSLYDSEGGLRAFHMESGGYIIGSKQFHDSYDYYCYLCDNTGYPVQPPIQTEKTWESNSLGTMGCNGKDRFVVVWVNFEMGAWCARVLDRQGNQIGTPFIHYEPRMDESLMWTGYYPAVSMAPDGRFVICWSELDPAGNLNLWAQTFDRDGNVLSAPFQVNDEDQWEYSFQISGWRGVSCNNERILFTWLENRRHRGWDVIAKVTDWDYASIEERPEIEHGNVELISPIGSEIVLRFADCPEGFHAAIYDAAGRLVDELHSSLTEGTISWGECHGYGVYFIKSFEGRGEVYKVVLVR